MSEATPLETIFFAALERPVGQRAAFVAEACAGDENLHQRVKRMLAAQPTVGSFLESPPSAVATTGPTLNMPLEGVGTQIGPYRLLQQIGVGGFGVVFMAEQVEPVRRRVAVKVIKPGMDTREVIARFDAERQALAVMDHPNIARVLDAGATESGRPYFVMELVRGVSITQHCDNNSLSIRERLELFASVCRAIQHAHTKGIIHRDVKPSNVLVTQQDGQAVVKVIDFGIAKAMGQQLTEKTLFTEFAQMIGTPLYMSPEQAELSSTDIDTRSDVYSLGVLLYELLTGSTPVSREQLQQAAFDEIRRIIREDDPPKPSTRISTAEAAPSIAAQRQTEPAKLSRLVRGELDWIVMKALEKNRTRRYETASGFARDIERYLNDEPVQACPPSAVYRFGKFARRNRATLAIALVAALTVLLVLIGLIVSNVLITQEKNLKVAALQTAKNNALAANTQKGIAERNAIKAHEQELKASANEKKAKENEILANRRYYAAQMNLAMQAWRAGDLPRVLELLEGQRPKPGENDLRGFEWFYLWRLVNTGGRNLQGHTDAIMALAFSPDGTTLASASWDWTVRLWDPVSLREQRVLTGHSPWHLAFSPDSKFLAGGSRFESQNPLWNVQTGERLTTLPGAITGLVFSPDAKTLFAGGGDAARIWEVPSVAQRKKFDQAGWLIGTFPDGKTAVTLASQSKTSELRFWDTTSGTLLSTIPATGDVWAAALSPDGTQIAASMGWNVSVWDTATGLQRSVFSTQCIARGLAFSPDGKRLAAGLEDRRAIIWDLATREQLVQYVHLDVVWSVAFSPDGKTLASGTLGGAIKFWDLTPVAEVTTIPATRLNTGQFSPDGKSFLVGNKGLTKIIDLAGGKEVAALPVSNVQAISADASTLASRKSQDEYAVWDIRTNRELATISFPQLTDVEPRLTLSPDGKCLAGYCRWRNNHTVTVWDVATKQRSVLKATPESSRLSVVCAEFSPDGNLLAAGFQFQWVTIWDVASGKVKLEFSQKPSMMNVYCVAFSPGGKTLAVGTDTGTVTLWDVETGQRLVAFRGHTSRVNSLAFSPDGHTLATAGDDKTVRLWDVITGQERSTLTGHTSGVANVLFSPDGYTVATGSSDGTVKFWRGATDEAALAPRVVAQVAKSAPLTLPPGALPLTEAGLRDAMGRSPDQVEFQRQLGQLLMADGRHPDAEPFLAEVVRLAPEQVDSHFRLSECLRQQKKFAAEETALRTAIRLHPAQHKLHHALGWALDAQQKFAEQELAFREVIRLKPDIAGAHYGLGRALKEQQKFAEASVALREAIRLNPADSRAHEALGWTLVSLTDFPAAELAFQEGLRHNPKSQSGHFGLGHALRGQKRFADALVALRNGIQLDPANHKGYEALAGTLKTMSRFAEAEAQFREVVRLAPDYVGGHFGLGRSLLDQRKFAASIEPLQEAIRLDPNHDRTHGALGLALLELRRFPEAEAELRKQVHRRPDDWSGHYDLGRALKEQQKFAEAIESLREALRLDPTRAYIHGSLGSVFIGQDKLPEAEAAFREQIRLSPDHPGGHSGLGKVFSLQKEFAKAEAALREAIQIAPTDLPAHKQLGWTLNEQKKFAEAEAIYREVVRLAPQDAEGHQGLGRALVEQKKFAEAETPLREALRLDPNHRWAPDLLKRALLGQGKDEEANAILSSDQSHGQPFRRFE